MKVVFIKDQPGGAKKGEIKEVSSGFASNFLLPKGFALAVTPQLQSKIEKEEKEAEKKKQKDQEKIEMLKKQLESRVFGVKVKVGNNGQMFGSVHEKEVVDAVRAKTGVNFDKHQITIDAPIKELGEYKVKVKLNGGLNANVKIKVEAI
ncbi:MAG: 50S ribosomal protein L9 [Candidatus Doudnabacteria bacterium CG10_big_fil_rev_8_21_14_0_10_42_18]|uniref:Large ribosomal subunit protein bL9 n=1 Tax=Candidatus Doudnabacteria bacterium CG10_big_fil_rev_8_21_14_0_10_42_18 TaxID=1974552 RepID=A0A2H0VAN5_9BACT|nr:MAG: 50S ribosomal protein L9 [Candidatus Doudnabacteria bacterium CG10_big_fil_rev_8_21_14_0_10_42_18]